MQVIEGKPRIDSTSLFRQDLHPIVRDHIRTIEVFHEQGIEPGGKGRNFICRRLLRRILPLVNSYNFVFKDWLESENLLRNKSLELGRRKWHKFKDKDDNFFWETYGLTPEDIKILRKL